MSRGGRVSFKQRFWSRGRGTGARSTAPAARWRPWARTTAAGFALALLALEALLVVGTAEHLFVLSGTGDVLEPDEGIAAVGSGGPYAQAAAMALLRHSSLDAEAIARAALEVAGRIDIYTNDDIIVEVV